MPITKQAIKKLRRDKGRASQNAATRTALRTLIKAFRKHPAAKQLNAVYTSLDKTVKAHVIHKNKAARLKSRLSKLLKK